MSIADEIAKRKWSESQLRGLISQVCRDEIREAKPRMCVECRCYFSPRGTFTFGGWVSFDDKHCSRCRPDYEKQESAAAWAREHPDEAMECKKKHEKPVDSGVPEE